MMITYSLKLFELSPIKSLLALQYDSDGYPIEKEWGDEETDEDLEGVEGEEDDDEEDLLEDDEALWE